MKNRDQLRNPTLGNRLRVTFTFFACSGALLEVPVCRLVVDRIDVDVDESIEFHCIASGTPQPRIEWTRPGGVRLPPHATVENGHLRIPRVRKDDEGEYICTATNSQGEDHVTGVLVVREIGEFTSDELQDSLGVS